MHASIDVIGPGAMVFIGLLVIVWAGSLYVTIDALRRTAIDYTGVREGRWLYAVFEGLYFLVFALDQVPWIAKSVPVLGTVWLAAAIPAVAVQIAYLLRVVFPTRARLDARAEARRLACGDPGPDAAHAPEADRFGGV